MRKVVGFRAFAFIILALVALGPKPLAQSTEHVAKATRQTATADSPTIAALRGVLKEEQINPAPFPHLQGTSPLTLPEQFPPDWSCPKCMPEHERRPVVAWQYWQTEHYFLNQIAQTPARRDRLWSDTDFSSPAAYQVSVEKRRNDLRKMLGIAAMPSTETNRLSLESHPLRIEEVTVWLQPDLSAQALVLSPQNGDVRGGVIAIPDASESRESFAGILEGQSPAPWLLTLLRKNFAVALPRLVQRSYDSPLCQQLGVFGGPKDERHILQLLGFIVGRTMTGIDVDQVIALRDYLTTNLNLAGNRVELMGAGQGGMTALYAAAADTRISGASVVDYFQQREGAWHEPADRMLYGQLNQFGDAEVAALIAPRPLDVLYTPDGPTPPTSVNAEQSRAKRFYGSLGKPEAFTVAPVTRENALQAAADKIARRLEGEGAPQEFNIALRISKENAAQASLQQFNQLHTYLRRLDQESDKTREQRWQLLSTPPPEREKRAEDLRKGIAELMGVIPDDGTTLSPRTRLIQVTDHYMAYDVLLGVVNGVEAYGQLLIPRHTSGRTPAVVCQHGYSGAPVDITGAALWPWEKSAVYWEFGRALADHGYVVFAPYITTPLAVAEIPTPNLVRLAVPLGMMRTSLEEKKLHKIVDFLQSLPSVDPDRIGYYGLSYGGYAATWMPPLEPRLRLTVISGHFNDWRPKITNEEKPTSYLLHQDWDFHNWDLLDRFTHPELIAAMYPRPVCVEFADRDSTTTPEWHNHAWKEVMANATAWGVSDRTVRSHFDGFHEIHGGGTIDFIDRWLRPEQASGRDYVYADAPKTTCKNCNNNLLGEVRRMQEQDDISPVNRPDVADFPFLTHSLDASGESRVHGRFHVGTASPVLTGLALRISRVNHPGPLIISMGTGPGLADIGVAHIVADRIDPAFDLWWEAHVPPARLDPGKEYFFELSTPAGAISDGNYYLLYGPKPLGGLDYQADFPVAYQVLTESKPHVSLEHERFQFVRDYMAPEGGGTAITAEVNRDHGDVKITSQWSIRTETADSVLRTASADLQSFFRSSLAVEIQSASPGPSIRLQVLPDGVEGISTPEGFRVEAAPDGIRIAGLTPRGVMRGIYWLEDEFRLQHGPNLKPGVTVRNCRLARRITAAVLPGSYKTTELSHPLVYTNGLLQRISHSGFNGIWIWANTEDVTLSSSVFPELDDPGAALRLRQLEDVAERARRFGIDVYIYLATGYQHHLPETFFQSHPEARGYGWGAPLCTSDAQVRHYYSEVVQNIFRRAPDLKGMTVIYDSEGFFYCGNSARTLQACPRCGHRRQQDVAAELLTTLDQALHAAGGASKELLAWNYNVASQWVLEMFPLIPKDIIIQADFDKGMDVVKEGIRNHTEDYNISSVGPPELFSAEYRAARAQGLTMMAKTEHAVSQEFIHVPYIPCMEQWYRRIAKIREYDLGGVFANWSHYGYTPSRPALLINQMAFDPAPPQEAMLQNLALRDFGPKAAPFVLRAWHDYSEGIRAFPYSDPVARYPGPLQKGPSNPLFIDPDISSFGKSRAWQNDLQWTKPWGPELTAKYLGQVEDWFAKGNAELATALTRAPQASATEIASELRIGRTLAASVQSDLNIIQWVHARDAYHASKSPAAAATARHEMETIALAERVNAQQILPDLDVDTRLGYASEGGGVARGGLFDSDLVRWKIGELEDLLLVRLPALAGAGIATGTHD